MNRFDKFKEARNAGLDFPTSAKVARGEMSLEEAMNAESAAAVRTGHHELLTGVYRSGNEYTGVAICFHDGKEWKPLSFVTIEDLDALCDEDDEKCFCGSGDNYLDCGCIPF